MPARLGRYAVRRRIGSGGFATVWLAYDEQLDSPVAIKVLAENWTEDSHVRQRFLEEGRYLRKVESPHVVTVYDAGSLEDDRPYLVMSYADQGTLADRLEGEGLTVGQASEVIRQVGEGLAALHKRGVLHRDIKPANVLFRTADPERDGTVVRAMVGDLGLGKALDVSSRLTMIAGTPSFVAPEQAQGEHLDARADQFSLAALTYLLLAGRPPYAHSTLAAAASPTPPAPLSTSDRPFPPEVEAVVLRGLAQDRNDRWPDVLTYVTELRHALGDEAKGSLPQRWLPVDPQLTQPGNKPSLVPDVGDLPEPVAPMRRRWPAAVLALVLLAAGGLGGFALWRQGHQQVTLTDAQGALSVTVPQSWGRDVARDGWTPPASTTTYPAVSSGDGPSWATSGQGVFVGLMPETTLPKTLPQHPLCGGIGQPDPASYRGDPAVTVTSSGCRGSDLIIERVVQVTSTELLWVQVRSDDEATARDVLGSVRTHLLF
ncbi:serine/threonine-protein kinase [Nocardioides cynanchi]|uniref:serine/threonine-protein kinase n=1 Tax=Nocardioides cynanchi TaxID=2558918 RepID=UPI001781BD66|nr:serine/threonine-protein kinase [Nocardioides cynanchi]